jgi:hypothetical protein
MTGDADSIHQGQAGINRRGRTVWQAAALDATSQQSNEKPQAFGKINVQRLKFLLARKMISTDHHSSPYVHCSWAPNRHIHTLSIHQSHIVFFAFNAFAVSATRALEALLLLVLMLMMMMMACVKLLPESAERQRNGKHTGNRLFQHGSL